MQDREKQIDLMDGAEQRAAEYLDAWKKRPEYRAGLRRYDYLVVPPDGKRATG